MPSNIVTTLPSIQLPRLVDEETYQKKQEMKAKLENERLLKEKYDAAVKEQELKEKRIELERLKEVKLQKEKLLQEQQQKLEQERQLLAQQREAERLKALEEAARNQRLAEEESAKRYIEQTRTRVDLVKKKDSGSATVADVAPATTTTATTTDKPPPPLSEAERIRLALKQENEKKVKAAASLKDEQERKDRMQNSIKEKVKQREQQALVEKAKAERLVFEKKQASENFWNTVKTAVTGIGITTAGGYFVVTSKLFKKDAQADTESNKRIREGKNPTQKKLIEEIDGVIENAENVLAEVDDFVSAGKQPSSSVAAATATATATASTTPMEEDVTSTKDVSPPIVPETKATPPPPPPPTTPPSTVGSNVPDKSATKSSEEITRAQAQKLAEAKAREEARLKAAEEAWLKAEKERAEAAKQKQIENEGRREAQEQLEKENLQKRSVERLVANKQLQEDQSRLSTILNDENKKLASVEIARLEEIEKTKRLAELRSRMDDERLRARKRIEAAVSTINC
jgi:hypothetical protein